MVRFPLLALALAGCAAPRWDGSVSQWGTLREVLRDGDTRGRVALDPLPDPFTVGLGALQDLAGEITILDGRTWVSRPDGRGTIAPSLPPRAGDRAAFLVLADVRTWTGHRLEEPHDLASLESKLAALAAGRETLPFIAEGDIAVLDAHVLNGACPFATDPKRRGEPLRFHRERVRGRIVGFYTALPAGTLTHHGSRIHAHVVLPDGPVSGHVDRATVAGVLRVPAP